MAERGLELPLICLITVILSLAAQVRQSVLALDSSRSTKKFPEHTVLGYVTPWNRRGADLVEEYRGKFDIVCPVWYTVHADEEKPEVYEVRGAPPSDEDAEWYRRLQQTSPSGMEALRITPRFLLDGWNAADYQALVFNRTRWQLLSDPIMKVVENMHYDGVVFESGATYALAPSLSTLSESLHALGKILVVVSPPIRKTLPGDATASETHDDVILESIASLVEVADYISIMTYDMAGPAGRKSTRGFPAGSPAQTAQKQGNLREPAPNTNAKWISDNLDAFIFGSDPTSVKSRFADEQQLQSGWESTTKFLAGFPLYGYTYPTVYIDEHTGQAAQHQRTTNAVAILRGAGEPITTVEIRRLLEQHSPEISKTDDGEVYFDWKNEDGFHRTFMPTPEGVSNAIRTGLGVYDRHRHFSSGVGLALWEVGQSTKELLSSL